MAETRIGRGGLPEGFVVVQKYGATPANIEQSMADQGMGTTSGAMWGPGRPLNPAWGYGGQPRRVDFMPGHNITNRPLRSGRVSFDALKQLTDAWDIARISIGHRIDDVRSLAWSVRPSPGVTDNVDSALAYARMKIKYPEGGASRKPYATWLAAFLEDVLRYDAGTLYRRRDKAGRTIGLQVVPGACYSDDTEVLTREGWKLFSDVDITTDEFATRNQKTKAFEWQSATHYTADDWAGRDPLYHFKSRHLDLLVTANHRMLIDSLPRSLRGHAHRKGEVFVTAEELAAHATGKTGIPATSVWEGARIGTFRLAENERAMSVTMTGVRPARKAAGLLQAAVESAAGISHQTYVTAEYGRPVMLDTARRIKSVLGESVTWEAAQGTARPSGIDGDDFAAFMGMWLSEGSLNGDTDYVYVSQRAASKGYSDFKALLTRMLGKEPSYNGDLWRFKWAALAKYLHQFGHAPDKFIPVEILDASAEQLRIFWRFYMLGDGCYDGKRERVYTASPRMAGGLQEVAQKIGFQATVRERRSAEGTAIGGRLINTDRVQYVVSLRDSASYLVKNVDRVPYDRTVYCVTVPNETLYVRRNGTPTWCGNTMAPLLDVWGGTPEPPAPAYTQWIRGQATKQLTVDDIIYMPFRPQSDSPYGFAPLESVILTANTDLRMQAFLLQRFTAGTVPEGFAEAPQDLSTPEQIQDFQDHWDATMYGDAEAKHQIKWVPNGTKFTWSKDESFDKELSMWMAKKCAAAFHVTINDLGITDDVNRATGDTQVEVQFRVGTLPLVQHVETILNGYLQDDLGLPVEFKIDDGQQKDDRADTANAWKIYIESGIASADEAREEILGLPADPEHPVPRFVMAPRIGPVPVSAIINASGPTDPESFGPKVVYQELSTAIAGRPFTPAIGAAPAPGTEDDKATASAMNAQQQASRQMYGKGQIGETPATAAQLATGVEGSGEGEETKKDVTGGITSATGFTGNPLLAGMPVGGGTAEDLLTQARRALAGGGADTPVTKADAPQTEPAGITHSGLAVKAADTGRILLLQRALTDGDPAGGTWELPGGTLDGGETPADGAIREWQEETGAPVPPGALAGTWDSGIYRGHVMVVPSEATVTINLDHEDRDVLNPDDPHGDMVETIAWWDPEDLPGLTALRPEMAASIDVWLPVIRAARMADDGAVRKDLARWRSIARRRIEKGAGDPCAFRSDVIPGTVAAIVRSRLATAATTGDVTAAFGVVVKGRPGKARGAWRDQTVDVPHRKYDLLITDYWVPIVLAAFEALWSDDQIMAACRAGDVGALGSANTGPLETALMGIWADAWVTGRAGALEQLDAVQKASLRDLKRWVPGMAKTIARATRDGMRAGLEITQIIAGILKTFLRSIALRLPSGRETAFDEAMQGAFGAIRVEVTASFAHAEMVTHSEIARVQTDATLETYREFGVTLWSWLVTDGACPRCLSKAAGGPYPLTAESPPGHPRCRCCASPVASSITY